MRFDEDYAYWELMVEKSYKSSIALLMNRGLSRFKKSESGKRIFVFGCNDAAKAFIHQNRNDCEFAGIFDNAAAKWGSIIDGIRVLEPSLVIPKLDPNRDVIVIALKLSSDEVAEQILQYGFDNIYSLAVLISQEMPYSKWLLELETVEKKPLENLILFESTNDFDGNAFAVYEFLKKHNTTHRMAWVIKNPENRKYVLDSNDEVVCPKDNYEELKRFVQLRAAAKWQIWDNNPIRKVRKGQINVFLQHFGMGYKQTSSYYKTPDYVDYILSPNEFVRDMQQSSLLYPETASFIYGELPRNDVLKENWNELGKLTEQKYSKTVIWMPTFRELDTNGRKDADGEYPFGVSLIYSAKEMERLNAFLRELDMLLVIKPHPRQVLNYKTDSHTNILYISGEKNKEIDGYKLLTQMDALITDYSSVVFDYMLLDRPVAFVLEDLGRFNLKYKMDDPDYFMPGQKIYTMLDMTSFFKNVYDGIDLFSEKRRKLCAECNPPFEGKGAENVVKRLGLITEG